MTDEKKPTDPLIEALREKLRALVDEPDLAKNLSTIASFANGASQTLRFLSPLVATPLPQSMSGGIWGGGNVASLGMAPAGIDVASLYPERAETFGAKFVREAVASLPQVVAAMQESPEAFVKAIAQARALGMPDVAKRLEARLEGLPIEEPKKNGAPQLPQGDAS